MSFAITKRLPCSVCGADTLGHDRWFLAAENRWLDRLRIFTWHPTLASQQGFKSACGRQHLRVLIAYWLDQASLGLIPANLIPEKQPLPLTSDAGRVDPDLSPVAAGCLVGELSVFREAFARDWTGSPETLESIVDALVPHEDGDPGLAAGFRPLQQPFDASHGLSLQ